MDKKANLRKRTSRNRMVETRQTLLGCYYIYTDTEATEKNYFEGLRNSLPENIRRRLKISVVKVKQEKFINKIKQDRSYNPQLIEKYWIVFDRDEVQNFDKIITMAEKEGIEVGWSNPCFEVWMHSYFGEMPFAETSSQCCGNFEQKYKEKTNKNYKKSDNNIYNSLVTACDETRAINIAERKYQQLKTDCNNIPSNMKSCTTVFKLVKDIKSKVDK